LASPIIVPLKTIDGDEKTRFLKHLNQPVQEALAIVRSRFKVFFNDAVGVADGLKRQFLIGHVPSRGNW
jgi:hypothetical protein